jgi:hypothetical protein
MKREDIVMSDDVAEFYFISPENRKSITVVEAVNAADHKLNSFCLIIQGQDCQGRQLDRMELLSN